MIIQIGFHPTAPPTACADILSIFLCFAIISAISLYVNTFPNVIVFIMSITSFLNGVKLFILYFGVKSGFFPEKYMSNHFDVSLNIGNSFSSQSVVCLLLSLDTSNHRPVKYSPSLFIYMFLNPYGVLYLLFYVIFSS